MRSARDGVRASRCRSQPKPQVVTAIRREVDVYETVTRAAEARAAVPGIEVLVFASFFSLALRDRVNRAFKEREPLIQPMPVGYNGGA